MTALAALDRRYRVILCDVWGCLHDGVRPYPGAVERLTAWRAEGRQVVLLSNAPRTVEAVAGHLRQLGVPDSAWDALMTSGEAGIARLLELNRPTGFLGTPADRAVLEARGLELARSGFRDVAMTGLDPALGDLADHRPLLAGWAREGVRLHCLNPDQVVVSGGTMLACAGSLATMFEALGGTVDWYGKPFPAIYARALALAGVPPLDRVLAIGDGLPTDMLGAARLGIDAIFVRGGIHRDEELPADLGGALGIDGWRPVAVVDQLG